MTRLFLLLLLLLLIPVFSFPSTVSHQVLPTSTTLTSLIRRANATPLSARSKRRLVHQLRHLLLSLHPYLPLHQVIHNVSAPMLLENFSRSITSSTSSFVFHDTLTNIFRRMRDRHTLYIRPTPFRSAFATLDLPVSLFYATPFSPPQLLLVAPPPRMSLRNGVEARRGATILRFGGRSVQNALELVARDTYGSNSAARLDNAVRDITLRRLATDRIPTEKGVRIEWQNEDGSRGSGWVEWRFFEIGSVPTEVEDMGANMAFMSSIRTATSTSVSMKNVTIANSHFTTLRMTNVNDLIEPTRASVRGSFFGRIVSTSSGPLGILTVVMFRTTDMSNLASGLREVLRQLPRRRLVIDVRRNAGGDGEYVRTLIELVSGKRVGRVDVSMRASDTSRDFLQKLRGGLLRREERVQFERLEDAVRTGERAGDEICANVAATFTSGRRLRQTYFGRVGVLVDGLTYSAGDMFAGMVKELGVGVLVGVSGNVGGGGSSQIEYADLRRIAPDVFEKLNGAGDVTIALLRFYGAKGRVVESLGVTPDLRYWRTRRDALENEVELWDFMGRTLTGGRM